MTASGFRYHHRLRKDAFWRYCHIAGLSTRSAIAAEMGVDISVVTRTLNGDRPVRDAFFNGAVGMFTSRKARRGEVVEELFDLVKEEQASPRQNPAAA